MPTTSKRRRSSAGKSNGRQNSRSGKDAISLLKKDHETVRQLLKRLESSTSKNRNGRIEILNEIENEVRVHTQIEEEIFYPAYRDAVRSTEDKKLYFEALEEHHVVDLVMPEIEATDEESDEFAAKAKVLKDLIEHHAEEEEKRMFPKARKVMGAQDLRDLGERLEERKHELSGESWTGGMLNRGAEKLGLGRKGTTPKRPAA